MIPGVIVSSTGPILPLEYNPGWTTGTRHDSALLKAQGDQWQFMKKFTSAGIPYTLCALSATLSGVYDKLKRLGLPLSGDPVNPAGIASFINDGYQIVVY